MFLTIFTILISFNLSLAQEGQDKTDLFVFINAETKDIEVAQRIVNGRAASLGEVPYQVAIKNHVRSARYVTICGGSIVRPSTVVSAAHCFVTDRRSLWSKLTCRRQPMMNLRSFMVVAGNLNNVADYSGADVDGQWRRIRDVKYPWQYRFPDYDIAVVILASPFSFNQYVNSIPYASRGFVDYRGECIASGYGRLSTTAMSPNLQIAKLAVLSGRMCDMVHKRIMTKFICTSDTIADVERGDSGGPLVCTGTGDPKETFGLLVGVTSGNRMGSGSFFTRVAEFSRFIDRDRSHFVKPLQTLISFCTGIILLNHLIVFV